MSPTLMRNTYLAFGIGILLLLTPYFIVSLCSNPHSSKNENDIPSEYTTALVLGCSPGHPERPNLYFTHRIDSAADLYHGGHAQRFILSGANPNQYYDEPTAMKAALMQQGVPADCITLDYAGLRTLDSVVRARDVFQHDHLIIVSQRFHTHRALYQAQHFQINAVGYEAKDPVKFGLNIQSREVLARIKLFLDLYILQTKPKFSS